MSCRIEGKGACPHRHPARTARDWESAVHFDRKWCHCLSQPCVILVYCHEIALCQCVGGRASCGARVPMTGERSRRACSLWVFARFGAMLGTSLHVSPSRWGSYFFRERGDVGGLRSRKKSESGIEGYATNQQYASDDGGCSKAAQQTKEPRSVNTTKPWWLSLPSGHTGSTKTSLVDVSSSLLRVRSFSVSSGLAPTFFLFPRPRCSDWPLSLMVWWPL